MKLWILIPCLMVGNAFASNFVEPSVQTSPVGQNSGTKKVDHQYPLGHITQPMGFVTFSAMIKQKFHGYNDLNDLKLAHMVVDAYPVYQPYVIFPETK